MYVTRMGVVGAGIVAALSPLLASAAYYGYGPDSMMGGSYGGGYELGHFFMMLVMIGLVFLGVAAIIRYSRHGGCGGHHSHCPHCEMRYEDMSDGAIDILKERYALGEIEKEEFETKKKDLLG